MIGQLLGSKRKKFMQGCKVFDGCTYLFVLMLLAIVTPAYAAMRQPVRALHFVVSNLTINDAERLIDKASKEEFNTVILGLLLRSSLKLRSTPWVLPQEGTWSRDDVVELTKYAQQKNIEIIPQLTLLSHQSLFLGPYFPNLMFNEETYDPRKNEVYDIIFPVIDELIELIHPRAIHIGHDEVTGRPAERFEVGLLRHSEKILPPNLFLDDVNRLHAYLKMRKIETWMWGDMLIAPDEFSTMSGDLNGSYVGYGQQLRRKIPKDVVICDWHYLDDHADFPSLDAMQKEGFRVIGTTWKRPETIRAFSRYSAQNGGYGMMATTWFHVQRKEWNVVDRIIRESGGVFREDFPDVK